MVPHFVIHVTKGIRISRVKIETFLRAPWDWTDGDTDQLPLPITITLNPHILKVIFEVSAEGGW